MKVLVAWADDRSTNLGVRALAKGAGDLVKKAWPDASVDYQSFGVGAGPVPISDRALATERMPRRNQLHDWIKAYDLVLDMRAGDSFTDIYGVRRLISMNEFSGIARRAGVPVVLGPQTIGPFGSPLGRALGARALRGASAVIARDSVSARYSSDLDRSVDVVSTDVVFGIEKPTVSKTVDIALNVSGLLWSPNSHVNAGRYRASMIDLCRELTNRGRDVTLFAHVLDSNDPDNDVPVLAAIEQIEDLDVTRFVPSDLGDVRRFVASANLVIGARMHACLNALSAGTPAIPLAYSRKFAPLLEDLNWNWTLSIEDEGDSLSTKTLKVMDQIESEGDLTALEARALEKLEFAASALERVIG
ncbi:polysaccharide pyruvyl transferase family protein [Rhodococcus sp. BL-253-APC-6A1W]|uniref:polysaccharide pyruvyl transferase family protein n=1 Tax=Rhodococcus sp. BL-253-APC-6A1W TaxID=2725307 RepID=UPI00146D9CA3|nr:polysaccharide pyruvyl transferase family protein [Rhodococcus sp. BL-253-APC-6A1W]